MFSFSFGGLAVWFVELGVWIGELLSAISSWLMSACALSLVCSSLFLRKTVEAFTFLSTVHQRENITPSFLLHVALL